ncbi:MAG: SRPBCC family protein [Anaerolineae bacterium]|nr:SRPBCC family protein [Anaerolineae bacterium]
MDRIEKSGLIHAPVEKVFAFMAEPHNLLKIWPSLLEIKNVEPLPNGGYSYDWIYKMGGLRFEGRAEWIEFVKDQRIVDKNVGGVPGTFVWTYQPEDGSTRVTVSVEYTIPTAALNRLAEPIIHKLNEHQAETFLANLKACMEA